MSQKKMHQRLRATCFILTCLFILTAQSADSHDTCEGKETEVECLESVEDLISKTKAVVQNFTDISGKESECGTKEKVLFYLNLATKLIAETKTYYPTCEDPKSRDCSEVLKSGQKKSGVYTIWPSNRERSLEVFCDMETDGGGWTVIQRRGNFTPQEDFFRNWSEYKFGFGKLTKDFWIGNDNLFALSNQGNYRIRFDLEASDGERAFAEYDSFRVEEESAFYKLHIGRYKGNAGNSMMFAAGLLFSTKERKNDRLLTGNCAEEGRSGWWFDSCSECNPNGEYGPAREDTQTDRNRRIYWYMWKRYDALAATEIKIKI